MTDFLSAVFPDDAWPAVVIIVVLAVLFFGWVIWSIKRHRDPDLHLDCDEPITELLPSIAGLTLGSVVHGNSIEVIENGRYFDVLLEEIARAQFSVHFETFLWADGDIATRVAAAFCERAKAGVCVRMLLDANGTRGMGKPMEKQLCDAGVKLVKFHRWDWKDAGVFNDRDHRKAVIFDGHTAIVGGHCITDHWLGDAEDSEHYADVSVRVRGPVVNTIQGAFSENWVGSTGELFVGKHVFPHLEPAGDIAVNVAFVKPENSAPAVKLLHHTVICCARKRIWIQNPYFIPEPAAIEAFGAAVKRGVDVRVLMPATSGSDNPMVQHAGHRNFEKMLRCGVRLFEYPSTLLHQKLMTVDGAWCTVGSANFDDRSFETNDEIVLGIADAATAEQLDAIFEKYAAKAQEITLERWTKRGVRHKAIDNFFYLINEVL